MKKVYVEQHEGSYINMWQKFGWDAVADYKDADVIQFTGGADVSAKYYDEVNHPQAGCNPKRDERCFDLFKWGEGRTPMAGICRGGQFLNVANGGKMFQHCDGHAIHNTHKATILESGLEVDVTSTHHQIMRPNRDKGIVLMEANPKLGTFKEHMELVNSEVFLNGKGWQVYNRQEEDDVEAIFYPDTMSLCFQPHPEYCHPQSSCVSAYRHFLRNHLELDV